jgi:hypothetical protein
MPPRNIDGPSPGVVKPREHADSVALEAEGSPSGSLGSTQAAWLSRLKALLLRA